MEYCLGNGLELFSSSTVFAVCQDSNVFGRDNREARCPRQKGRGHTDFVFYIMTRKEIQASVSVGWPPININDSNTISPGNKGVQESNLTIVSMKAKHEKSTTSEPH